MNSLSIRIPKNNTTRKNTVVSPRSGFTTPLTAKNVIVPLKNVEAKIRNYTVKNYVNSKNSAKKYVQDFCSKSLVNAVRFSPKEKMTEEEKSYYLKSCDLAGIARVTHTPNKGPIAASPSWASGIKRRFNAPVGGKQAPPGYYIRRPGSPPPPPPSTPTGRGGKRKTRKHRKSRKATRKH